MCTKRSGRKILGNSEKFIRLKDNAYPHMENLVMVALATMKLEFATHPPYRPDLTPSDFNLFGPMKVHLGGQRFGTDGKIKHGVLNWLSV
jgi:hypothetical protein